ncbi:MAG: vanadium-dependent haloperoxidase [Cytophagales bacterium]|nr:vanadium-dependent haloperoxidase [Cytophagales bacterium]
MKRLLFFLGLLFIACNGDNKDYKALVEQPEFLHRTLKQVTDVIVHDIFSPPVASRIYAYCTIAAYEAIIPQDSSYVSLAGQLHGLTETPKPEPGKEYCFPISSMQAMFKVGRTLIFSEDKMDVFYRQLMSEVETLKVRGDVLKRSIDYGNQVADHILEWSGKDNYKQSRSFPKYSISNDPATWKPTPPAYMDAVEPHWNKIRTFVIDSAGQFKPNPPTPFSTNKTSQFYKEALAVYEAGKMQTPEQREIAFFWDCNPFMMNVKGHVMFATKKISPGGHWINITATACRGSNASVIESAEAYVRVSIALADAFISCWDEKYRSLLIRPETYINQYIDEDWVPTLQTPPFPEYTSGHSVISAAAADILTDVFGESFAFTDSTENEFGLPSRNFKSFKDAAEEAAVSRFYGGIHYTPACENGTHEGHLVGEYVKINLKTKSKKI